MGVRWGEYGDIGWGRWMRAQRTLEISFGSMHYEREHANSRFRNFYVQSPGLPPIVPSLLLKNVFM